MIRPQSIYQSKEILKGFINRYKDQKKHDDNVLHTLELILSEIDAAIINQEMRDKKNGR